MQTAITIQKMLQKKQHFLCAFSFSGQHNGGFALCLGLSSSSRSLPAVTKRHVLGCNACAGSRKQHCTWANKIWPCSAFKHLQHKKTSMPITPCPAPTPCLTAGLCVGWEPTSKQPGCAEGGEKKAESPFPAPLSEGSCFCSRTLRKTQNRFISSLFAPTGSAPESGDDTQGCENQAASPNAHQPGTSRSRLLFHT